MSLPTPAELDEQAAASLREALMLAQRAFATGLGCVTDFPRSKKLLQDLQRTFAVETAVEAAILEGEQLEAQHDAEVDLLMSGPSKRVACMVDGSANALAALRWAVAHLLDPVDDLYLITVVPYQDYASEVDVITLEAWDHAHLAGVPPTRLHRRTLSADAHSATRGVGESLLRYVEDEEVDVVVLGSRGMGSVKRSIMASMGMGSVSDWCVQHLRCPILVIKNQGLKVPGEGEPLEAGEERQNPEEGQACGDAEEEGTGGEVEEGHTGGEADAQAVGGTAGTAVGELRGDLWQRKEGNRRSAGSWEVAAILKRLDSRED